ncbi:MAG TPA: twin-arginine translocase TatA/TatE family subunit [Acidobacteriaceae bacterium]
MPSFQDSAVLVILALLLFGPKKLPVLARQLGKLMADFRRASNEFRTQMEEELRISEQADRQKQIAALEASAPSTAAATTPAETIPAVESDDPDNPHIPPPAPSFVSTSESTSYDSHESSYDTPTESTPEPPPAALPIAVSGDLSIMPPSTGLPIANSSAPGTTTDGVSRSQEAELETETLHG